MSISSVTSSPVQLATISQSRPEGRIEGNTPDGDGDLDDLNAIQTVNSTSDIAGATELLGNNINVRT